MTFMKKSRLGKSLIGITLSLSIVASGGSMLLQPQTAAAATVTASKADQIISTAQSYQGRVTYRFGVRDPQHLRFDCSSFVQYVFKQNGISLPWGSRALANVGTKVSSKSQLQKGDLILFSVGTPGRINHVGIYVGNGKFIGNSPSKGVAVYSLNTGYWKNRFIMGRHL